MIKIENNNTDKFSSKPASSESSAPLINEEYTQEIKNPLANVQPGRDLNSFVLGHIGMICKIQNMLQYPIVPIKNENSDIEDHSSIIRLTQRGYCLNIRKTGCNYEEMRFRIFFAEMQKSQNENWEVEIGKCLTKSIAVSLYPCLLKRIEFILLLQNARKAILTLPFDMAVSDKRKSVPTSHCNASSESGERVCFGPLLTDLFSKLHSSPMTTETIPLDFYLYFIKDMISLVSSYLTEVIPSYSGIDIILPDDIPQPSEELSYSGPNRSIYDLFLHQFIEGIFQDDLKWLSEEKIKKKDNFTSQGTKPNKKTNHDESISGSTDDLPNIGYQNPNSLVTVCRKKSGISNKRSWIKTAPMIAGPFRMSDFFNKPKNDDSDAERDKKLQPEKDSFKKRKNKDNQHGIQYETSRKEPHTPSKRVIAKRVSASQPKSHSQHKKVKFSHVLISDDAQISNNFTEQPSKILNANVDRSDMDEKNGSAEKRTSKRRLDSKPDIELTAKKNSISQNRSTEKSNISKKICSSVPRSDVDQTSKYDQQNQYCNISKMSRQTIYKKSLMNPFAIRNDLIFRKRISLGGYAIDKNLPPPTNYRPRPQKRKKDPPSSLYTSIENEIGSNSIGLGSAKNEGLILKFKRLGKQVNTCLIFIGGPYSSLQIDDSCTISDVLVKTKGILYDPPTNHRIVLKIKLSETFYEFPATDAHLMTIRAVHELLDMKMSADILLEEVPNAQI